MQSQKLTPKEIVVDEANRGFKRYGGIYEDAVNGWDSRKMDAATQSFQQFVDDAVDIEFLRPLGDAYRMLQKVRLSCPAIVAADVDEVIAIIRNLKEDVWP